MKATCPGWKVLGDIQTQRYRTAVNRIYPIKPPFTNVKSVLSVGRRKISGPLRCSVQTIHHGVPGAENTPLLERL